MERNVSQQRTDRHNATPVEADPRNPHTFAASLDGLRRLAVDGEALATATAEVASMLAGGGRDAERVAALAMLTERSAREVLDATDRIVARLDAPLHKATKEGK